MKKFRYEIALIFVFLSAIYGISYSGTFITDDEHILASRALSYAFDNEINDYRVYGNTRISSYMALPEIYKTAALNIEPIFSFAASFLARISTTIGTGRIQSMFLMNIWITAITGAIVFLTVRKLGFSRNTAIVTSLAYGIGTAGWPYSTTFFRDPLASLLLLVSWSPVMIISKTWKRSSYRGKKLIKYLSISIIGLLLGIGTKNTVLFIVPILILMLNSFGLKHMNVRLSIGKRNVIIQYPVVLITVIGSALFLWQAIISPEGGFARNSLEYYLIAFQRVIGDENKFFWEALIGPFISPGKSIFLYSPILLLSLYSLIKFPKFAWPAWSYLLLLIVGQGFFYDDLWWGSINWGLRFILPAIPLLTISAAPIIERMFERRLGKWLVYSLLTVSIGVQFLGIAVPLTAYYLSNIDPNLPKILRNTVWSVRQSPIVWHFNYLTSQGDLQFVIERLEIYKALFFGLLVVSAGISLRNLVTKRVHLPAMQMFFSILLVGTIPIAVMNDPVYLNIFTDNEKQGNQLYSQFSDLPVAIYPYSGKYWKYAMNWFPENTSWVSIPQFQTRNTDVFVENTNIIVTKLTEFEEKIIEDYVLIIETRNLEFFNEMTDLFCSEANSICIISKIENKHYLQVKTPP